MDSAASPLSLFYHYNHYNVNSSKIGLLPLPISLHFYHSFHFAVFRAIYIFNNNLTKLRLPTNLIDFIVQSGTLVCI